MHWPAELIVKISEIIGIIGVQKGEKWFDTHFPELLDYYKTVVIPACKAYLHQQGAHNYLHNEPQVGEALAK